MSYEFKFPDVGEGVHEGKVLQLLFKPGDRVEAGETLAVVETDKVTAEIPSPKSGTLERYGAAEGQVIHVGETLAVIRAGDAAESSSGAAGTPAAGPQAPSGGGEEEAAAVVGKLETAGNYVLPASGEGIADRAQEAVSLTGRAAPLATPMARKLAADLAVDLARVRGSGPAGRVMKSDILAADRERKSAAVPPAAAPARPAQSAAPPPPLSGPVTRELSTLRKAVARAMEESHKIPAVAIHDVARVGKLLALRREWNEGRTPERKLSLQAILMKALAVALRAHPQVNATYDAAALATTVHPNVHVGFAAQGAEGLVVPVVRGCDALTIDEIGRRMNALVGKLRDGSLTLDELRGGTITVTNYGAFGGIHGTPMILPPQVAILGFGRIHEAPVVEGGAVVPASVLPVSFRFDHRALDGAPAGAFLTHFLRLVEEPARLLLSMA